MPHFESFLHHETGLRHRTFRRVDEHEHAVDHHHYALYFAREIRMPRSVDDVYFNALVVY